MFRFATAPAARMSASLAVVAQRAHISSQDKSTLQEGKVPNRKASDGVTQNDGADLEKVAHKISNAPADDPAAAKNHKDDSKHAEDKRPKA